MKTKGDQFNFNPWKQSGSGSTPFTTGFRAVFQQSLSRQSQRIIGDYCPNGAHYNAQQHWPDMGRANAGLPIVNEGSASRSGDLHSRNLGLKSKLRVQPKTMRPTLNVNPLPVETGKVD